MLIHEWIWSGEGICFTAKQKNSAIFWANLPCPAASTLTPYTYIVHVLGKCCNNGRANFSHGILIEISALNQKSKYHQYLSSMERLFRKNTHIKYSSKYFPLSVFHIYPSTQPSVLAYFDNSRTWIFSQQKSVWLSSPPELVPVQPLLILALGDLKLLIFRPGLTNCQN